MTDFTPYQRQHLFLLIGGNTLPNYVSAKLLAKRSGAIYLIYTSGTKVQANNIRNQLVFEGYKVVLLSLRDADSNAYEIRGLVRSILEQIPIEESIGLNYTGGTKAMAVHAYIALGRAQRDTLFTYLNPRDRAVMVDHASNPAEKLPITVQDIALSLNTLFQLHNTPLKQTTDNYAHLPILSTALAQAYATYNGSNQWLRWLKQSTHRENGEFIFHNYLDLNRMPRIVSRCMREQFQLQGSRVDAAMMAETLSFDSVLDSSKWFGGLWLENYTLACIENLVDAYDLADLGRNFILSVDGTYGFEFDVAFTRGYQLYALSCTTAFKRKLCKQKLLEAAHRAQQMGGSEAKVALVCCNNDPASLKAELSTLPNPVKVEVFSLRTSLHLTREISQWIEQDIKHDEKISQWSEF